MRINGTTIDITAHSPSLRVYNVLVDVLRPVRVQTSTGAAENLEVIASNISGHIKWKSGNEKILFDKTTHLLDATLKCRVIPGVTIATTDRIRYNGDTFEIVDVVNVNNLGQLLSIDLRKIE